MPWTFVFAVRTPVSNLDHVPETWPLADSDTWPLADSRRQVIFGRMQHMKVSRPRRTFLALGPGFGFGLGLAMAMSIANQAWSDDEAPGGGPSVPGPGRSRHAGHAEREAPRTTRGGKITGRCTLIPSSDNPIGGPCANLMLVLNDSKGGEVDRERTTPDGEFELSTTSHPSADGLYRIGSGSRFYDVASPKALLRDGYSIELTLKSK